MSASQHSGSGRHGGFGANHHSPTLLLVPRLDLYNPVDDAIEAAKLVPSVTLVRLDGQAGHAVATDTSPELDDIRGAIGKFLTSHAGPR
jgi:hypothetical protein